MKWKACLLTLMATAILDEPTWGSEPAHDGRQLANSTSSLGQAEPEPSRAFVYSSLVPAGLWTVGSCLEALNPEGSDIKNVGSVVAAFAPLGLCTGYVYKGEPMAGIVAGVGGLFVPLWTSYVASFFYLLAFGAPGTEADAQRVGMFVVATRYTATLVYSASVLWHVYHYAGETLPREAQLWQLKEPAGRLTPYSVFETRIPSASVIVRPRQ